MDTGAPRVPMMRDLFLNPSHRGAPWMSPEMRIAHEMQKAHKSAAAQQTAPSKSTGKRAPRRKRGTG